MHHRMALGAVLFQSALEFWKPVVFASRSMSETERRYVQIEQEALATTWACEKLADYLLGRKFTIESDHKPLIPLLNSKQLDSLSPSSFEISSSTSQIQL